MSDLRFVERRDEEKGWATLIVIGAEKWATMRFVRAEWAGWKHAGTVVGDNGVDWPDMSVDEIVAWMRREWSRVSEDLLAPDPAAVAAKFAPEVRA